MPHENRFSLFFVQAMLEEAIEIESRINEFGITEDSFKRSSVHQDLLTAPLLRIGELVSIYLPNMEALAPDYPWRDLAGLRNIVAHPYGGLNHDALWLYLETDLPDLVRNLEGILE